MACELCQLRLRYPTSAAIATYLPGATFGPRQMRDWEFVWLIEGNARYQWANAQVDAPEGSIVLCRPGATDYFWWDAQRRTRHAYFHFQIDSIPGSWPAVASWPFVRQPRDGDVLRGMFRYMLTPVTRPGMTWRLTVEHMLAAFVFDDYNCGDVPRATLPPPVDRALRHIQNRLDQDAASSISLPEMARAAQVTPEHLCRLFRNSTGHSPSATVLMARLDRALVLLARSNYRIGEIAAMCGFASQFHFSRRFSAAFGHSPRTMRARIDAGQTPPVPLLKNWG